MFANLSLCQLKECAADTNQAWVCAGSKKPGKIFFTMHTTQSLKGQLMKIAVGMSGGVDSAMVAALLHQSGHQVVGVSMLTWKHSLCCSFEDVTQARLLCRQLGFKHFIIDLSEDFRQQIVEPYIQGRLNGCTPNPCPQCNRDLKLGAMWQRLQQRLKAEAGAELLATGHYVRLAADPISRRLSLWRARDQKRDQSYMLWRLSQEQLQYCLFPLGEYLKPQLRELAADLGLGQLAHKPDSQDLCFLTPDPASFWQREAPEILPGPIVDAETSQVLGQHQGLPFYTLGQRRGLKLKDGQRRYVQSIQPECNTLVVSRQPPAEFLQLQLNAVNYLSVESAELGSLSEQFVQVRLHGDLHPARWLADPIDSDRARVIFHGGLPPVAAGQSVVCYTPQGRLLAGGLLAKA